MRALQPKHVVVLIGFLGSLATSIAGLDHGWRDALTPQFIAGLLGQLTTILTAVYMGAPDAADGSGSSGGSGTGGGSGSSGLNLGKVSEGTRTSYIGTGVGVIGIGVLLLVGLLSGGAVLTTAACGGNRNPNLTPAGQRAATADQAVQRIGELQQATIDASDAGKIKVADARVIVSWCVEAVKALRAAPDGWVPVALTGYLPVKERLLTIPELRVWVPVIDGLLGVL